MNDLPVAEKGKESGLKGNLKKTVFKVSNATVGLLRLGNETSKFVFLSEAWASNLSDTSNSWKLNYTVIWRRAHATNNNFLALFLWFSSGAHVSINSQSVNGSTLTNNKHNCLSTTASIWIFWWKERLPLSGHRLYTKTQGGESGGGVQGPLNFYSGYTHVTGLIKLIYAS